MNGTNWPALFALSASGTRTANKILHLAYKEEGASEVKGNLWGFLARFGCNEPEHVLQACAKALKVHTNQKSEYISNSLIFSQNRYVVVVMGVKR